MKWAGITVKHPEQRSLHYRTDNVGLYHTGPSWSLLQRIVHYVLKVGCLVCDHRL